MDDGWAVPRRLASSLLAALLVVLLDQFTKQWILTVLPRPGDGFRVTRFFNIVLAWNTGVSFSLFNNAGAANGVIFSLLAAIIVLVLLFWLWRARNGLIAVAIGLVVGGAIGNVIDRLRLGHVVDFLDFHAGLWHWPDFNVADSAVCIGVGLMLIDGLLGGREASK